MIAYILLNYSNRFFLEFPVYMTTFLSYKAFLHNIRLVYLCDHGYNAEGNIMEEIPAGGCSYIYLVGDFSFGRLPEEELML